MALVITRSPGKGILITLEDGRHIHILVSKINGSEARLAIDAPKTISIWRDEIFFDHEVAQSEMIESFNK
jgi:carbon storage regulator CsrA